MRTLLGFTDTGAGTMQTVPVDRIGAVCPLKKALAGKCGLSSFMTVGRAPIVFRSRTNSKERQMLELRPNCELCDCDLPPDSAKARICSYECTYCADCVDTVLGNVCPKCGGDFQPRPIRPRKAWRADRSLGLGQHPASVKRVHTPFSMDDIREFTARLKDIAPNER
jgi:hypothetical protein